ncbi:probable disease resistance protein At1g61300 [Gastrolobium bilobum]|uniref:probable disease resistance protein At1g61300 n=1 Tax=Gastrolobium bilobum TaxID=150636 RepID=UPI002AAF4EB9|nr:probable disease resistance protein At1g61300 [Gastrolobium bilobum]
MESIPADLAKKGLEKLIDKAIAESRYICCFSCIVADFKKQKGKLEAKRKAVGQRVDAAKRNAREPLADATYWREEVGESIQEETETEKAWFFRWCPNCIWQRYSKGKALSQKTEEIKKLLQENLDTEGVAPQLPGVEYYSSEDYISFKGRELKYEELLNALRDDNNYITGLQGMGGTGKTTLAKEVGKQLKRLEEFQQVIFTTVSYTPDIRKIQDDIAVPLGLELKDKSELERRGLLWKRLTDGEKNLLILDDVWDHEDIKFEEIGIPGRDDRKGCRVFLTTRKVRVCKLMGSTSIINLDLLSNEDAWTLFMKHAVLSDSTPQSLLNKGLKIVLECKGLPIAISVLAKSLKDEKREEEWDEAINSLQKTIPRQSDDDADDADDDDDDSHKNLVKVYNSLRFSYDRMKNKKAKRMFLLCSMFPEDEELSTEILTRYVRVIILFGEVGEKYDGARSQVVKAKNELIDSGLLLKAEKGHVKMHDLVREVALSMAKKEILAVNLANKREKLSAESQKNIKYLLCQGKDMDLFSFRFDASKLKILKVCVVGGNSMEMPNSFFENMTNLRVLHLSSGIWGWRLSLPQSIESLKNIRSLFLERLKLGDISILGKLHSLEALDLVDCVVVELPREIAELERLRLLHLYRCLTGTNNALEVIERHLSLEELYFIQFKVYSSANDKKITLPELQRYHITERYTDGANDSMPKYVCASYIDGYFSEATFKYLVQTTEILKLEGIMGEWKNLIPEIVPIDEGMNYLVKLRLESWSELQCLIDTSHINSLEQNVFSKLVVLELEKMENLEELCIGPLPSDFLKCLETLFIKRCYVLRSILFKGKLNLSNLKIIKLIYCPKLVNLFQLSTSQSLVLLEELEISFCEQLENIIAGERIGEELGEIVGADNDNNRRKSYTAMFPNLKMLFIAHCPRLEFIFSSLSARDVPVIESIDIGHCGELKYIFGKYQHENEEASNHLGKSTQCLSKQSQMLHNIKEIQLYRVSKIESVFIMSITPTMMLETLIIRECDELKHVIIDTKDDRGGNNWGDVFPKLEKLLVKECGQLEYIFEIQLQNHNEIQILLPALKYLEFHKLPNLIGICSENYRITFPLLTEFTLSECYQFSIKSIGELSVHDSRELGTTTIKVPTPLSIYLCCL